MKHLFLPYEIALKLKDKRFDESCLASYKIRTYSVFKEGELYNNPPDDKNSISAPLYQQVIDWFREKHDIIIQVDIYYNPYQLDTKLYEWSISNKANNYDGVIENAVSRIGVKWQDKLEAYKLYHYYYEALNKAIEEALKLI